MSRADRAVAWVSAGLILAGPLLVTPQAQANERGRGSVRHSSTTTRTRTTTTTRTTARPGQPVARPPATRPPAARPPSNRASARAGYRAGYRHGYYHSWHNARRDYWRWRTVTGLFRLGVYAATSPKYTTTVVVTGTTYYYVGGVYYVPSGSGYVVVSAPPGAVVYSVPTYTTTVYVGTTEYLYVNGTYYVPTTKPAEQPPPPPTGATTADATESEDPADIPMIDNDEENYEVVAPPPGATVPYLPEDADEETVNGKTYFVYAGTYYRPFASDGETIYMVVADPNKA